MRGPFNQLPKALQDERSNLVAEQQAIEDRIRELDEEIAVFRSRCKHKRPKDLTGYEYAVYCTVCGHMIDSWL